MTFKFKTILLSLVTLTSLALGQGFTMDLNPSTPQAMNIDPGTFSGIWTTQQGGTGLNLPNFDALAITINRHGSAPRTSALPSTPFILDYNNRNTSLSTSTGWAVDGGLRAGITQFSATRARRSSQGDLVFDINAQTADSALSVMMSYNGIPEGGTVSVWLTTSTSATPSPSDWFLHRVISTYSDVATNISTLAASPLSPAIQKIKFVNETGAFNFTGLYISDIAMGGQDTGFVPWNQLTASPLYTNQNKLFLNPNTPGTLSLQNNFTVSGNMAIGGSFVSSTAPVNGLLVEGAMAVGTNNVPTGISLNVNGAAQVRALGVNATPGTYALSVNGPASFQNNPLENVSALDFGAVSLSVTSEPGLALSASGPTARFTLFDNLAISEQNNDAFLSYAAPAQSNQFSLKFSQSALLVTSNTTSLLALTPDGALGIGVPGTWPGTPEARFDLRYDPPAGTTPEARLLRSLPLLRLFVDKADSQVSSIYQGLNGDWDLRSSSRSGQFSIQGGGGITSIGNAPSNASTLNINADAYFSQDIFVGGRNLTSILDSISQAGSSLTFSNGATVSANALSPQDGTVILDWPTDKNPGGLILTQGSSTFGGLVGTSNQLLLTNGNNERVFAAAGSTNGHTSLYYRGTPLLSLDSISGGEFDVTISANRFTLLQRGFPIQFQVNDLGNLSIVNAGNDNFVTTLERVNLGGDYQGGTNILNFFGTGDYNRGLSFDNKPALSSAASGSDSDTLYLNPSNAFNNIVFGRVTTNTTEVITAGSMSAYRFYDMLQSKQRDNSYYLDPNDRSVLNDIQARNTTLNNLVASTVTASSTVYMPEFRDTDNLAFLVNPNAYSALAYLSSYQLFDLDDTRFYVEPGSQSQVKKILLYDKASRSNISRSTLAIWNETSLSPTTPTSSVPVNLLSIAPAGAHGSIWAENSSDRSGTGLAWPTIYAANHGNSQMDYLSMNGTYASGSSRRWKSDIRPIPNALERVLKLNGVMFTNRATGTPRENQIGFIAEEVGEQFPNLVIYEANDVDAIGIYYSKITAVLVEALKEEHAKVSALEKRLEAIEKRLLSEYNL